MGNSLIVFNLAPLKTAKILWPSSAGQTVHCLRKLHFQSLISVSLFVCVLLLQKKVNRLGVSPLSRRDQNMCSNFSQFFSSAVFILTAIFWPCCGCSAASLGWCAVETPFRQISFWSGIFACPSPLSFKIDFLVIPVDWLVVHIVFCSWS